MLLPTVSGFLPYRRLQYLSLRISRYCPLYRAFFHISGTTGKCITTTTKVIAHCIGLSSISEDLPSVTPQPKSYCPLYRAFFHISQTNWVRLRVRVIAHCIGLSSISVPGHDSKQTRKVIAHCIGLSSIS